eukprot:GSA25T00012186001.1
MTKRPTTRKSTKVRLQVSAGRGDKKQMWTTLEDDLFRYSDNNDRVTLEGLKFHLNRGNYAVRTLNAVLKEVVFGVQTTAGNDYLNLRGSNVASGIGNKGNPLVGILGQEPPDDSAGKYAAAATPFDRNTFVQYSPPYQMFIDEYSWFFSPMTVHFHNAVLSVFRHFFNKFVAHVIAAHPAAADNERNALLDSSTSEVPRLPNAAASNAAAVMLEEQFFAGKAGWSLWGLFGRGKDALVSSTAGALELEKQVGDESNEHLHGKQDEANFADEELSRRKSMKPESADLVASDHDAKTIEKLWYGLFWRSQIYRRAVGESEDLAADMKEGRDWFFRLFHAVFALPRLFD